MEEESEEEPDGPNAVMLSNRQMEVYNEGISKDIPEERRNEHIRKKMAQFLECFDENVQIIDLYSDKPIIQGRKNFSKRYSCVFRESGMKLKGICHKRFFYAGQGKKTPSYCLDFETHEHLVTATPGTPPDGKLGVREPRTEHLVVLYEEKGGRISRFWLASDKEKLGLDTHAGEDVLRGTERVKAFEKKVAELRQGRIGSHDFHNYHEIPTIG